MDFIDIARFGGALLLVLSLLGLAGLAAKRFGVPGMMKAGSVRRLHIAETLMVGPRQKLIILRRDGHEHLLFISPQGATVIEQIGMVKDAPQDANQP